MASMLLARFDGFKKHSCILFPNSRIKSIFALKKTDCSMVMGYIVIYAIMALMIAMGIVILAGKGDGLIAGYNTASSKEREKVNIKRLRLLVAIMLFLSGALIPLLTLELMGGIAYAVIIMMASFVVVYLANTWAMKK